jgi:dTDP-glucose 4,6-dehydratase
MTSLLLTGIGGSIGCHTLAHVMHNTDWNIVGIDSFRHKGLTDRVEQMLCAHPEWRSRVRILVHDLTAPISPILAHKIGPIDYLINMASLSDVQAAIDDPGPFIANNVMLAVNVLDYARNFCLNLKAFIQISTDEVYGPCGETTTGHAEWSPILPSNPYAASKAAQEAIAISYWRSYGIPLIITNTMNNFGEMQQPQKFPAMVQRKVIAGQKVTIHGNRQTIGSRYYLHSRNHADALLFILRNTNPYRHRDGYIDKPDRYNIVGDRRVNNLELAQTIAGLLGKPLDYELVDFHSARPGHDRHYGLDGAKLAALGWRSPLSFERSLQNTLVWTSKNPEFSG